MKIECPICHSKLIHKRFDDGFETHEIDKDGTVECIGSKCNGGDYVYCSQASCHKLPEKLVQAVLRAVAYSE